MVFVVIWSDGFQPRLWQADKRDGRPLHSCSLMITFAKEHTVLWYVAVLCRVAFFSSSTPVRSIFCKWKQVPRSELFHLCGKSVFDISSLNVAVDCWLIYKCLVCITFSVSVRHSVILYLDKYSWVNKECVTWRERERELQGLII